MPRCRKARTTVSCFQVRYALSVICWAAQPPQRLKLKGHPELGIALLTGLMKRGIDPAFCMESPKPEVGIGHSIMRPAQSLTDLRTPIVPILINCYYAPQPTARRCLQVGRAVREVVEELPGGLRVAVIGSGGMWHTPQKPDAWLNEEFDETLRYFRRRLQVTGVALHLGQRVESADLLAGGYDAVLLATGVTARDPRIPGQDDPRVLSYVDVLQHGRPVGPRVAIVGAGGIGFDMAEYLSVGPDLGHASPTLAPEVWRREWGVADPEAQRGGVVRAAPEPAARVVTLLQRKPGKHGAALGKTTGWIHRAALKMKQVEMLAGVNYERIGAQGDGVGLFITFGESRRDATVLEVDTVVLCAGQEPRRELQAPLVAAGVPVHLIGGADVATELDAKRAIDQATRLAATL